MTAETIISVVRAYQAAAVCAGVRPVRCPDDVRPEGRQIKEHLVWMSHEIEYLVQEGRIEKAMRWLGFIQGILWAKGVLTISDLADQNSGK